MKKFNVILVSAILITLALTWFAFPMTVQAATATFYASEDTWLDQNYSTNNYGSDYWLQVTSYGSWENTRSILKFDISSIPAGSEITSATLKLYLDGTNATGRTYYAYRLTETGWWEGTGIARYVETGECSWLFRQAYDYFWDGGTYTTTGGASATVPSSGEMAWNVKDQVQTAYTGGIDTHFLIKDASEGSGTSYWTSFKSTSYGSAPPTLEVTYTSSTPTISSFIPTSGGTDTSVTITGTNFTGATAVKFGGTDASGFTVDTPTQITATVGSGTTGTVSVTTSYGTATSTNSFTYLPPGSSLVTLQLDNTDATGADAFLMQGQPTTNNGGYAWPHVQSNSGGNERMILKFDISSIPAGSTVIGATLKLKTDYLENSLGRTHQAYRLTQTDWVEGTGSYTPELSGTCCWTYQQYATLAWTSAGGTYTTDGGASATVLAAGNWMEWTVTDQVQYACTNDIDAHFLIRDGTENGSAHLVMYKGESTGVTNAPKLEVTYTVSATFTWTGSSDQATWANADNWSGPAGYPEGVNDKAVINSTDDDINTGGDLTIGELEISGTYSGTLTLGGALTLDDADTQNGAITIASGTLDVSNYQISIDGDWTKTGGTFTSQSGTVVFTKVSGTQNITSGGASFFNITFSGTGGTLTLLDALDINGALLISAGTFIMNNKNMNVTGNLTISSGAAFTKGTGTLNFDGTTNLTDNTSTKQDLGKVKVD